MLYLSCQMSIAIITEFCTRMSLCFQSFNYLPRINCCISRDTSQSKGKKNHVPVKPPLPVVPQAEETNGPASFLTKNSSVKKFSGILNDQANGIGIIAGLSVDLSLSFAKKLVKLEDEKSGTPFVLCSDPGLNITEQEHIDHDSIIENLRRKRAFLEKCGVCCIVMPCHVSHCWHDEIKEGCCVPFLHMGECVAKELTEAKLRPIEAGSPVRIGVVSTNEAFVTRVYGEKLKNEGFEVVLPDKATMEHAVIPAVEALSQNDIEGAQNLFRITLQVLLVRAVNKIVVASDEFRELLPPDDPLWTKCIDPMDALARSAVEYAQSFGRGK